MSQTMQLIDELKRQLKHNGKSYKDVAEVLQLSEASVKRLFSHGSSLTIERLEQVCSLINIELGDLILSATTDSRIRALTLEQEKQVVSDLALLLVAVCVFNGYQFEDILRQYQLTEHQLIQKLALLDRLRFIELLPGNKIKLKISPHFHWLPGGPIQTFFQQKVREEFFHSYFNKEGEKLSVATGLLSVSGSQRLHKRIDKLIGEFYDACKDDQDIAFADRKGTSIVVAIRPWQFTLFEEFDGEE